VPKNPRARHRADIDAPHVAAPRARAIARVRNEAYESSASNDAIDAVSTASTRRSRRDDRRAIEKALNAMPTKTYQRGDART
jgi:hypothetical protein|tara:strand:+ start:2216 stop:2461 length:246 start_codon:yes stop_codon:yes gene_type:complete